jgi:chorismate mutase/prephenate dehydratase
MKNLDQLRSEIDDVDYQMVELLKQRMDLCGEVATYKKENNLPVLAPGRERALLTKAATQAGTAYADYTESVFRSIMSASRSYQRKNMGAVSEVYENVRYAVDHTENLFPQRAMVACQGIEGAYSQVACQGIFKSPTIMYFDTFENVFKAVESGLCRYGVLPIENSTAGSVNSIYNLMLRHNFSIVRSARLKVSHNLLANHGAKLENIKEIYSHEQAINQCAQFLAAHKGVKVTVVENTAMAAKRVAESGDPTVAALSSRFCEEYYGLESLCNNVQDQDNNYTRFICISKKTEIYPGADRTSLMMIVPHQPGSLYNVLAKFNALGINVRKIESRPLPDREFEFMFYFDIEASIYAPEMEELFLNLECESEDLRYLGTYSEVLC